MNKLISGYVDMSSLCLLKLPSFLYDVEFFGNFDCSFNYLSNLEGAPKSVN